jgi:hypothetical protein
MSDRPKSWTEYITDLQEERDKLRADLKEVGEIVRVQRRELELLRDGCDRLDKENIKLRADLALAIETLAWIQNKGFYTYNDMIDFYNSDYETEVREVWPNRMTRLEEYIQETLAKLRNT